MKKSIIAVVVLSALSAGIANANVGMLSQDPTKPSTNYDDVQDKAYQAAAALANSSLNQNQQIVKQVNTVGQAVGQNALAIGQTNQQVGQNAQQIQQNWNQQNQNNQVLVQQINKNAAQINGLTNQTGNFVTKPDFKASQDAQDKAINDETTARVDGDKQLQTKIDTKADKAQVNALAISTHNTDIQLQKNIDSKVSTVDFKADQSRQDSELATEKADRSAQDATIMGYVSTNATGISDNANNIAANGANIAANGTNIAANGTNILNNRIDINNNADKISDVDNKAEANHTAIVKTGKQVNVLGANQQVIRQDQITLMKNQTIMAGDIQNHEDRITDNTQRIDSHSKTLSNHETRISDLEKRTNSNFANIDKRINNVSKKANAGTSTALAAAGIPQVLDSQKFAVGAATGGYEGESALAVGFSARVSTNVVVKASVATDSQHGFGYNAGVAIGW